MEGLEATVRGVDFKIMGSICCALSRGVTDSSF